ncbi:MAG: hypothetical protein HQK75_14905, partial [Candidatus Magnetomorum sp.]|nr:hypothetical protein [Candidatus Magnetomorum sp.]
MEALITQSAHQTVLTPPLYQLFDRPVLKKRQPKISRNIVPEKNPRVYISEDDYWQTYYEMSDVCYEWNDGVLEEKPMADFKSFQMYL